MQIREEEDWIVIDGVKVEGLSRTNVVPHALTISFITKPMIYTFVRFATGGQKVR